MKRRKKESSISGDQLLNKMKELIDEGKIGPNIVKHERKTLAEFPLTVGIVEALLAPQLAATVVIGALLAKCRIEIERE